MVKTCSKCGETKAADFFWKKKDSADGRNNMCIACCKVRDKAYRNEHSDAMKAYAKKSWSKHRDARLAYDRARKEKKREWWQRWKENNPDKYQANAKKQRSRSRWILRSNIGRRIRHALVGGIKSRKTEQYIGIDVDGLKAHIEKQFEPWMSWDNYCHENWHIDHIIPCSAYDLSDDEEAKKCFNYRNMRPLASRKNFEKRDAVDLELVTRYGISDLLPIRVIEKHIEPITA